MTPYRVADRIEALSYRKKAQAGWRCFGLAERSGRIPKNAGRRGSC